MAVAVCTLTIASIIFHLPQCLYISMSFIFIPQIKIMFSMIIIFTVDIISQKSTTQVHDMSLTYYSYTTIKIKIKIIFT